MKPNDDSFGSPPSQRGYRGGPDPFSAVVMKVVTLRRRGNAPLGFSIRGGWEHGTGVFISEVVSGSIAQRQGLRVGDQIVRINGFSIHRAIHMEVLNLLKTCPGIVLKIKRVGILPIKERTKDPVTWKIVDNDSPLICSDQVMHSPVNGSTLESCIIVKIEIDVPGSSSLGCSIAKGPSEMPGIFMCTVKEGGVADQAGLQVGDQILDMNGTSFADVKLNEAVSLMKSTKNIRLSVKKGAGVCLFLDSSLVQRSASDADKSEDALSTSSTVNHGPPAPESAGSCSSKSEESSFQSSDSEKEFSISEESAFETNKAGSPCSSWVLEGGREEAPPGEGAQNPFLQELQRVAARMNTREGKEDDPRRGPKEDGFKGKKCKEDAIKRMQHEMLMEEFREAHRKMFGLQSPTASENKENGNRCMQADASKTPVAPKTKGRPPPPPPKDCQKITVNGQVPSLQSRTLPRPDKTPAAARVRSSVDDMDGPAPRHTFRVTVTDSTARAHDKGGSPGRPKQLVEVTPWTTRL